MTVRARSTPTNPNTQRQRTVKYALAVLTPSWGGSLSQTQRDAWNLYGDNVLMTNTLGQPFHLTGQNHFMRTNIPRIQSGLSVLATAPTVFDLGTFTPPTISSAFSGTQLISIAFDNTDGWANNANGHMLCYGGRPTNAGRAFYGGPYRFGDILDGNPAPPASPFNFISPWPINSNQLVWAHIRIIQADGRMSLPIMLGPETVI